MIGVFDTISIRGTAGRVVSVTVMDCDGLAREIPPPPGLTKTAWAVGSPVHAARQLAHDILEHFYDAAVAKHFAAAVAKRFLGGKLATLRTLLRSDLDCFIGEEAKRRGNLVSAQRQGH